MLYRKSILISASPSRFIAPLSCGSKKTDARANAQRKQLQLLELVKEQVKFLYLLEGRPPVMSEHEYGIMANFMCDSVPTVRQYRKILFSLLDEGTNSYYYIKAMAEFFWTP